MTNKNEACQGLGCPQASASSGNEAPANQGHDNDIGATLSGQVQVVRDSVTTWMWYSSLAVFALFGMLSLALIWKLTGTVVRQLESISRQAANLDLNQLGERIVVDKPYTEIGSMAGTLNTMLERMEKSSRAQQNFVRNASHELRTPITTIGASLESLISQGRISPDVEPTINRAIEANRKSGELITALLELSRVQSATEFKNQPVELEQLMKDLLRSHQQEIQAKQLVLDVSGLVSTTVATDSQYIEIALDNLLRNAIIHNIFAGQLTISADTAGTSHSGKLTSLHIINSTDEIQPAGLADSEVLTRCFYRGNSTRLSNKPGYGLGLSIVKEITDNLGLQLALRYPEEGAFETTITFTTSISA
ncbi:HAMP domain-containing sensor histidine kinase [Bombiscardovia apis]|uniref:HAMP domain-containing sensor histidine kinase n=1 Tax=Bombiscardovia apis TaxID=2932182 RepID=UPI002954FC11|nr:HAMP domain-containing sensor histidine kinase [Bombiscardovia apis]